MEANCISVNSFSDSVRRKYDKQPKVAATETKVKMNVIRPDHTAILLLVKDDSEPQLSPEATVEEPSVEEPCVLRLLPALFIMKGIEGFGGFIICLDYEQSPHWELKGSKFLLSIMKMTLHFVAASSSATNN
jgi:hypothetical protein